MTHDFTSGEQEQAFDLLSKALAEQLLPTKHGAHRQASADEFMLMQLRGGFWGFKHGDTRNYLFVNGHTGALRVPMTMTPFMRGYFDAY